MKLFTKSATLFFIIMMSLAGVFQVPQAVSAAASAPELIKDINLAGKGTEFFDNADESVSLGGLAFFEACTDAEGCEPWVSDGTEGGTHILKDVSAGTESSGPEDFIVYGAYVYFFAQDDEDQDPHLHRSDGTLLGTTLVDLGIPMDGDNTRYMTVFDGKLYFTLNNSSLVKSDGTEVGTSEVANIAPIISSEELEEPNIRIYAAGGSQLMFGLVDFGEDFHNVYLVNGSDVVTPLLDQNSDEIDAFGISTSEVVPLGDDFLFSYDEGINGQELWKYDAANGFASIAVDIRPGSDGSELEYLEKIDSSLLYFRACSDIDGCEPWVSDGSASGTSMLKDIIPGSDSGNPSFIATEDGLLYFTAYNGDNELKLFVSDGTSLGTEAVYTVPSDDYFDGEWVIFDATLYTVYCEEDNCELYKVNDNKDGIELVKEVRDGEEESDIEHFMVTDQGLIFVANDGIHGEELWVTDGTESGTELLRDITSGTLDSGSSDNNPSVIGFGGKVYFEAINQEYGVEIWVTDGTEGGTHILKDIYEDGNSYPDFIGIINNTLLFIAEDEDGKAIWATDGTESGTHKLNFDGDFYDADQGQVFAGKLWFGASTGQTMLFTSDGETLTQVSEEIKEPDYFTVVGDKMYFKAYTDDTQRNLWVTDGTEDGTVMIKQIVDGGDASIRSIAKLGTQVFFDAYTEPWTDKEVWVSDGTEGGTMKFADIGPGSDGSDPQSLITVGNKLFFYAYSDGYGRELWVSDGTVLGTHMVKDIVVGGDDSSLEQFVAMNDVLYFVAHDSGDEGDLWRSDGTESGTYRVKDINPGGSPFVGGLVTNGVQLYFSATTEDDGAELWVSDGTEVGTVQVSDVRAGEANSSPVSITDYQDKLFWFAHDGFHGSEPWMITELDFVAEEEEPEEEEEPVPAPSSNGGGSSGTKTGAARTSKAVVTAPDNAPTSVVSAPLFTRNLETGASGSDVKELQKFLNAKGFVIAVSGPGSIGNETDTFGALTKAALAKFQAANGIVPAVGYFGPVTQALIASLGAVTAPVTPASTSTTSPIVSTSTPIMAGSARDLTVGDEGADVKALQAFLMARGYTIPAGVTGYFAIQTKTALAAYQAKFGILPAVGYFGAKTRAHMTVSDESEI